LGDDVFSQEIERLGFRLKQLKKDALTHCSLDMIDGCFDPKHIAVAPPTQRNLEITLHRVCIPRFRINGNKPWIEKFAGITQTLSPVSQELPLRGVK
jgi:hypothetical protein